MKDAEVSSYVNKKAYVIIDPCDFDSFNIPVVTVCQGYCAEVDINNTCEIGAEYTVTWGGPVEYSEINNPILDVCPRETTSYPLTIKDENENIVASVMVTVEVSKIKAAIQPEYPKLCGGPTEISVETTIQNAKYKWSNGSSSSSLVVSDEGEYSVTISNDYGCTVMRSVKVWASRVAELSISTEAEHVCKDGVALLEATEGVAYPEEYQWSTGEKAEHISVTKAGTYALTVTNFDQCVLEASYTIEESSIQAPDAEISLSSTELCSDGHIFLSVEENESDTYYWSNGAKQSSIKVYIDQEYDVIVNNPNGCQSTDTVVVADNDAPSLDLELSYVKPTVICNKEPFTLSSSTLANPLYYTTLWSNGATTEDIDVVIPGVYEVTVTSEDGCETTKSVEVYASSLDFDIIVDEEPICEGGSTRMSYNIIEGKADKVYWSNNVKKESTIVSSPDKYWLTMMDKKKCTVSKSVNITQSTKEGLKVDLNTDQEMLYGNESLAINATITAATAGVPVYDTITWSDGTTNSDHISTNKAGDYSVTVTAENGCETISEIEVEDKISFFDKNCFIAIPIFYIPSASNKKSKKRRSSALNDLSIEIDDAAGPIKVSDILSQTGLSDLRYSDSASTFKIIVDDYKNGVEMAWGHVEKQEDGTQLLYMGSNAIAGNESKQLVLNALYVYWKENQKEYYIFALPLKYSCDF